MTGPLQTNIGLIEEGVGRDKRVKNVPSGESAARSQERRAGGVF